MKKLAAFFIDNYKLTIVLTFGVIVFGAMGLYRMNSETFPAVDFAQAIVTTRYDGASAEEIETKITKPIEDEVRQVSGLKDVRSTSSPGLSQIFIRADIDNIDVDETMSDLQKAVDRVVGLPKDINDPPEFLEINSEEFPVFEVAITGPNDNRQRDLVTDRLKEELEDNDRVKSIRLSGFAERRFQIKLNRQKMIDYHIGLDEVLRQVQRRSTNIPGGPLKQGEMQKLVRIEGEVETEEQLRNVLVRSNFNNQKIFLGDIAQIEDSKVETPVRASYNGDEATFLTVTKKAGADTIAMVKEIEKTLQEFRQRYENGLEFHVFNNESERVAKKLDVLSSNALTGLALVFIFLLIFLPGRIGFMASFSLPIAVIGTMGFMQMWGMNLDAITILALIIAIGMLVDNSVVITENYSRLLQEGYSQRDAAVESIRVLALPISATAFTTIAAFLPMLVTKGIMGQFIRFIPITVTFSLILSLAESFFFLPMRLVKGGGPMKKAKADGTFDWFNKFERKFESFMNFCISKRWWIFLTFGGLIGLSLFLMISVNKFILFPSEQTEVYISRIEMEKGTRVEKTLDSIQRYSKTVKKEFGDDIEHIVAWAGEAQTNLTDPKAKDGNHVGILTFRVSDYVKYNVDHHKFLERLREIRPDYIKEVQYEGQVNGPPVGNDIEATFRSNSFEEIDSLIGKIRNDLFAVEGIVNLQVDNVIGDDEVYVNVDYTKADKLGFSVEEIGNSIRTAVSGSIASVVTLNNKDVDLFVRFREQDRRNIEDLKKVRLMDERGNLVPLGTIADFEIKEGSPYIKRYDFKRSKTLTGTVDAQKITSVVANNKLENLYDKYSKEHPTVSLVFGGAAESTKESLESLFNALIISLIGIFALLVFLFRSYLRPGIIMSTIPLGLLGFSIAFYFHGRPISFMALIGIIGLGGIIVNAGIVLISFIDNMREETQIPLHDILVKASGMRLRAVVVTSLTTISGLIPTAYGIGGEDAMLIPMTLAMAWGLTSGTILTLVWVPCAYGLVEDVSVWFYKFVGFLFGEKRRIPQSNGEDTKGTGEGEERLSDI